MFCTHVISHDSKTTCESGQSESEFCTHVISHDSKTVPIHWDVWTKFCTHVISHDSKTSNMDFSECFMPHFSVAKSAAHIFDYNIIYLIVNYFLSRL